MRPLRVGEWLSRHPSGLPQRGSAPLARAASDLTLRDDIVDPVDSGSPSPGRSLSSTRPQVQSSAAVRPCAESGR